LVATGGFAQFSGGNGTKASPFRISSKVDWEAFVKMAGEQKGIYFLLTQDLNKFNTITTRRPAFSGNFDGGGHEIEVNLTSGLFYELNSGGVIENLIVSGTVKGTTAAGSVGGICDRNYTSGSTIRNCWNKATVSHDASGMVSVGGIVGGNYGSITNCYNTGEITGHGNGFNLLYGLYGGGIVGACNAESITNCYNTGNIHTTETPYIPSMPIGARAGGICGALSSSCRIENCFAANTSLTGTKMGRITSETGGTVTNCYALSGMTLNGGITTDNTANDKNGKGMDKASFQSRSWITQNLGWDFDKVWKANSGGYPSFLFDSSTGIEEIPSVKLTVYPNPATDYLYIKSEYPVEKVELYRLTGQLAAVKSDFTDKIDVSALPAGCYLVRVHVNHTVFTQKVFVGK
jgi:hypothetical protein